MNSFIQKILITIYSVVYIHLKLPWLGQFREILRKEIRIFNLKLTNNCKRKCHTNSYTSIIRKPSSNHLNETNTGKHIRMLSLIFYPCGFISTDQMLSKDDTHLISISALQNIIFITHGLTFTLFSSSLLLRDFP